MYNLENVDFETRRMCLKKYLKDMAINHLKHKNVDVESFDKKTFNKCFYELVEMFFDEFDGVEEDVLDCIENGWAEYLDECDGSSIEDVENEEYVSNVINPFVHGCR